MFNRKLLLIILFIGLVACTPSATTPAGGDDESFLPIVTTPASGEADLVMHNGAVYTVNSDQPWAEAVAIKDGEIIYVGDDVGVDEFIGDNTEVVDLDGKMVMPGFQDPHQHALEAGINQNLCLVSQTASSAQYISEIQDCAAQQPDSEWVRAAGANMSELLFGDDLPLDIIDQAVSDRPVIVLDDLGHGAWLNSLAMQAVGYDTMQGDPPGGIIVRDPDTGDLTGIVLENAQQAARTASIPPTPENLDFAYEGLLEAMAILGENGITSISDAGGYWTRGHHTVWQRAVTEDTLTVRASNAYYVFPDLDYETQIAELENFFSDSEDSLLRFNQAKIYVDGILSQGTGALLSPYNQSFELPGVPNDGFLYFDVATLNDYSADLAEIGYQLHYHVTGDRGARLALDAIEAAQGNDMSARHRLTHLYLVDSADRPRFEQLGVVGDWQLSPDATSDEYYDFMLPFLGQARADELLPAFSIYNQYPNAIVTISSDWDADEVSPFRKISSVLAVDWGNLPTLDTIIEMMTLNVAYLLHQDDITGSIEVGKMADLIVLDQNLFEVSPAQIENTKVLWTLLEGEEVYRDPSFNN